MAFRVPGTQENAAAASPTAGWTREDVERWLTDFPLPANFVFNGERAYPKYKLRCGYGQWLRTAGPYHPALRGLFSLICDLLIGLPVGTPLPGPEELAAMILDAQKRQGVLELTEEDRAAPGARHPGEHEQEHDHEHEKAGDEPEPF